MTSLDLKVLHPHILPNEKDQMGSAVTIIIPCRNEVRHIETCLLSILSQTSTPGDYEIIVADGMSDDGTRKTLKQLSEKTPNLFVIDNHGLTVSTGLNTAIKVSRGHIIIRMDAHTEYASDYVKQCVEVLQETGADNVGGPARTRSTDYMQSAICAAYHSPFSVGGARFHDIQYEGFVDTVPYGCWRRELFERLGGFDEELVRNQDDEFNLRTVRAGGKIWQSPRIQSWYSPRGSLRALFQQYTQYGYWKVRVIQKHKIPASFRHLIPSCFVLLLLALPLVSWLSPLAGLTWLGLVGSYTAANLAASFLTASQKEWRLFPVLPIVFACFHFGYGLGFLSGLWDFIIRRRGPRRAQTKLTRTSKMVL